MSVIKISTVYGNVYAKDLQLVDIHDVLPMEDEENIEIRESKSDETKSSEVAPEATTSPTEDSSM